MGSASAGLLITGGCTDSQTPAGSANSYIPTVTPAADATATPANDTPPPLRVAFSGVPKQFDPALMTTIEAYHMAFAIFDALVWIDEELITQPLLAVAWQSDPGQLAWTFELRRDVKFHSGAQLTAQDVVYTFKRLTDPDFNSSLYAVLKAVESIEAVDEYTVRFHLSAANAEFPSLLGAPQAGIVPDQISVEELTVKPVGAGPFQFVDYVPGEQINMQRNADYWDAEGIAIESLEYRYFASFAAQTAALLAGEVDMLADIDLDYLEELATNPELTILEVPSGRYQTIVMQATEAPFTDQRVRQALKHCANRPLLQDQVLRGKGNIGSDHPVAPVSPFWADLPQPTYDIDKARQLLAAAGYPDGLKLSLITSVSRPGMMELATSFAEMARPAGIEIEVTRVPADVYWTDYGGKVPFHIGNWNFRSSIDETFTVAYHSQSQQNESKWQNPDFDALIEAARGEGDLDARKTLYQKAQVLLMEEGAVVIPYFRPVLMAVRNEVHGFKGHPSGWLDFHGVTVNPS